MIARVFRLIAKRIKSKSPELFKKIALWAAIIGAVAITLPYLPITLPAWILGLLPLIASAMAGLSGGSILTTGDEKIIKETNEIFPTKRKK